MAYITENNLKKILIDVDKRKLSSDLPLTTDIKLMEILSIPELQWLHGYKLLCIDPSFVFDNKLQKISPKKDTKTWANEQDNAKPSYHYDKDCERLKSKYINFKIPDEVKNRGNKEIERFRAWFKENIHILETNEEGFIIRLKMAFNLHSINDNSKLLLDNSGVKDFETVTLEETKIKINKILHEAEKYRNSRSDITKEINKWGYATHKCPDVKNKNSIIYTWNNYKIKLKLLIMTYLRIDLNPDREFESQFLENLGFIECKHCKK